MNKSESEDIEDGKGLYNMKRRPIYILFSFIIVILGFSGCSRSDDTAEYVTRGEWISMLAEGFGLESYPSETPYYSDVTTASEWFPSVQATAQWDILSIYSDDDLDADKPLTYAEMASTAAIAAGFRVDDSQKDETGKFDARPSIDYATQHGIVSPDVDSDQPMTRSECEAALAAAQEVYIENPGEEKIVAVPNPELVDLSDIPLGNIQVNGDIVSFPSMAVEKWDQDANGSLTVTLRTDNGMRTIKAGTTFVTAPDDQAPFGAAHKVTRLEVLADGGAALTTVAPSLGDIYDDVDIHTTVSLEDGYIIWADGVIAAPAADQLSNTEQRYHIELLASPSGQSQENVSGRSKVSFSFTLPNWITNLTRIGTENTMPISEAMEVLQNTNFIYSDTPSIEDFNGSTESWTMELTKEPKYDMDYKIEGKIDMDIQVTADVEYHKLLDHDFWPKAADLSIQSDVTASLEFEGELTGEFEIGEIVIPLGVPGFSVNGTLFLYAEANGSVSLKVEFINDCRTAWQNPGGFREPYMGRKEAKSEQEAALDLSTGVGVGISLNVFTIKVIGTDLKLCGDLEVTGAIVGKCQETTQNDTTQRTYTEALKVTSDFYVPIISVTVSGPEGLSDIFDLEKEFELIGKDKAKKMTILNKEYVFWTMTVELDAEGNIIVPPGPLEGDFSEFAGTYRAVEPNMMYDYIVACHDLVLNEDGSLSGGGYTSTWETEISYEGIETVPIRVETDEESMGGQGTFQCVIVDIPDTELSMEPDGKFGIYVLYPVGVARYEGEDTSHVRLYYAIFGGGIFDMYYTKID